MAILSGGKLVLTDTSPSYTDTTYYAPNGLSLVGRFSSYAAVYRAQLWVYVAVNKLALATARLPFKVYERTADDDRVEARDNLFAEIMRRPNPKHDPFFFWAWTASTKEVYGEAMWVKVRDSGRAVRELWPLHPVNVEVKEEDDEVVYYVMNRRTGEAKARIPATDVVHFKTFNPDTAQRGLSPIEPLRQTLLNEDAARRATAAFWTRGARPATVLKHPMILTDKAKARLKASWEAVTAGTDNTGSTAILEEGMDVEQMQLTQEEAQYIETRKLNREEVCAAYDIPPPAVHILDRATFSNIREQFESVYRDTMAPRLASYESTIDVQLRPEFGEVVYGEFLLDEVLRGAFEDRADAKQKAINSAQMTPNEARRLENLPALPGGDRLFINSTLVPIDEERELPDEPAEETEPQDDEQPAQLELVAARSIDEMLVELRHSDELATMRAELDRRQAEIDHLKSKRTLKVLRDQDGRAVAMEEVSTNGAG